jgi:hypothetical protein
MSAAVTGEAHDTLRDELAEAGARAWVGLVSEEEHGLPVDANIAGERLRDALLPVVLRYADAQVAAERERIAAAIEADGLHFPPHRTNDPAWLAARIARAGGQP